MGSVGGTWLSLVLQAAVRLNAWMSDFRLDDWVLMKMGECSRLRKLVRGDPGAKGEFRVEMGIAGKRREQSQVMKSLDLIPCPVGNLWGSIKEGKMGSLYSRKLSSAAVWWMGWMKVRTVRKDGKQGSEDLEMGCAATRLYIFATGKWNLGTKRICWQFSAVEQRLIHIKVPFVRPTHSPDLQWP